MCGSRTVALLVRWVRRVHLDLNGVRARRHHRLTVAPVEHEVLPAELEHIGVSPTGTDALETVTRQVAATAIGPRSVSIVHVERIGVEHAEAALCRFPFEAA